MAECSRAHVLMRFFKFHFEIYAEKKRHAAGQVYIISVRVRLRVSHVGGLSAKRYARERYKSSPSRRRRVC